MSTTDADFSPHHANKRQINSHSTNNGHYQDRKVKKQPPNSARAYVPSPHIGRSQEEPTRAELLKMLEEKQQRLDFADQELHSVLLEKKEFQEKNEFLEESLAAKNETIVQLQRTLKQRSKLVHTIMDLENEQDDEKRNEENLKSEDVMRLERQLTRLNNEKNELQFKTRHLEELKQIVEKREERRIAECMSQLRGADLKVAQLQAQLNEKASQCESQADEVQRLLKEISQRKMHEKILWEENDTLQSRLDQALCSHEQLRAEIEQLQEQYFDLISMLREMEDELKMHREKAAAPPPMPPRRTNSTDSLYDSLASELEGADSGCYNTPMFSARYGTSPHWSSLSSDQQQQQMQPCCSSTILDNHQQPQQIAHSLDMEPIMEQSSSTCATADLEVAEDCLATGGDGTMQNDECTAANQMLQQQRQSFDVPSRALLEVVRSTFEDRRRFRRMSPSWKQQQMAMLHQQQQQHGGRNSNNLFAGDEGNPDEQQTPTVGTAQKIGGENDEDEGEDAEETLKLEERGGGEEQSTGERGDFHTGKKREVAEGRTYRDATCSPIQFPTTSTATNATPRNGGQQELGGEAAKEFESTAVQTTPGLAAGNADKRPRQPSTTIMLLHRATLPVQKAKRAEKQQQPEIASSSSVESVDSLEEYNPPKLGAPGKPGTRDLDFSIRRLNLRKQINNEYQRFRECKGLQPSQSDFYTQNNAQQQQQHLVFQTAFRSLCPSKQLSRLSPTTAQNGASSSASFPFSPYRPACSHFLIPTTSQIPDRRTAAQQREPGLNLLATTPMPSSSNTSSWSSTSLLTAAMCASRGMIKSGSFSTGMSTNRNNSDRSAASHSSTSSQQLSYSTGSSNTAITMEEDDNQNGPAISQLPTSTNNSLMVFR